MIFRIYLHETSWNVIINNNNSNVHKIVHVQATFFAYTEAHRGILILSASIVGFHSIFDTLWKKNGKIDWGIFWISYDLSLESMWVRVNCKLRERRELGGRSEIDDLFSRSFGKSCWKMANEFAFSSCFAITIRIQQWKLKNTMPS